MKLLLFSDETHVYLSGHVNKHNLTFWTTEQLHEHMEKPLSVEKSIVWYAVGKNSFFGSHDFEDNEDHWVTVHPEQHAVEMLHSSIKEEEDS